MTIKEYAISRAISYEAAAKQVRKYKTKELKKHIKYVDRSADLDEYAISFLDEHRQPKNVVVAASDEEMQQEINKLRNQIFQLQSEIKQVYQEKDRLNENIKNLLEEKTLLIEDKTRAEMTAAELQGVKQELDSYKPVFLGFYRKIKSQQPTDQDK